MAATLILNSTFSASSQSKPSGWSVFAKVLFKIVEDVAEEVAENPELLA
ncbi:MAG: hypothetical protein GPJ10_03395 [Microcystis aeruginosa L211-07]|nr:hypothetical protein [Microcystis aeruginosa L211-07]